jgi:protocatechuate 3,4-dioxygenase beta subunit
MSKLPSTGRRSGITRREAITWLGAAGVAAVAAACGVSGRASSNPSSTSSSSSAGTGGTSPATTSPSCVLSPEMTEGPYYIDGEAIRSDVTEGKPGVPLHLDLTVVDASSCTPIKDASIEIWHADADGNYSGFNATAANTTFLRGVQVTDAKGKVGFDTIYPGWYVGRAVHIHLKAHVGGSVVHTGQLFFDEAVTDAVYTRSPYNARTGQRTTNGQDSIYAAGGAQSTLSLTRDGSGYTGTLAMCVQSE